MNQGLRVYIAGPMSGHVGLNFDAFNTMAKELRDKYYYDVVNPAEINPALDADWTGCMIEDIRHLVTCDAVMMLRGWEHSKGAITEWLVANAFGLDIYYEDEDVATKPDNSGAD